LALSATIYNFDITLADVDRNVYEEIALRVACHPSESPEYLVARVLAYCLEYTEGIAFGRGLSEPDDPPIAVKDLTGTLMSWIEIGSPDASRLHKASKAAPRVAVYTHKDPRILLRQLDGERIHRADALEIYAFDRELIDGLVPLVDHRPPGLRHDRRRNGHRRHRTALAFRLSFRRSRHVALRSSN
jgi:uncharacterized protein YaeQ